MIRKPQPQLIEAQWELVRRLPTPRRVRSRVGTRILYGLVLTLFAFAPAAGAAYVANNYFELATLRSRGATTTGQIVHVQTKTEGHNGRHSSKSTSTIVDYEFEVDGRPYRFSTVQVGSVHVPKGPAEVVYLPENPERATSRSYLSLPYFKTQSALLMIVGALMAVIGCPLGWFLMRPYRRHRRLLIRGVPAVATIDGVVKQGKSGRKVDYVFQAGGGLRQGSVVVEGIAADKTEPGQRLAMLYDPADPRSTDLFFAAVESYLIVEPKQFRTAS